MRWLVWCVGLGLPLAVAQAMIAAAWQITIPAALGVMAWSAVEGRRETLPWRAAAMAAVIELADPAPGCALALCVVCGVGLVALLRRWLFPGWIAICAALLLAWIPVCAGEMLLLGSAANVTVAVPVGLLLAMLVTLAVRWILSALPSALHPHAQPTHEAASFRT